MSQKHPSPANPKKGPILQPDTVDRHLVLPVQYSSEQDGLSATFVFPLTLTLELQYNPSNLAARAPN